MVIRFSEDGLVLHTLFYPDELHEANRQAVPKHDTSRKELDLAKSLVQQMSGPFKPSELHDEYRENVEKLIEQKRKGKKVTPIRQPRQAAVIDLMDALKKSLKSTGSGKKEAAETKASKPKPSRRRVA